MSLLTGKAKTDFEEWVSKPFGYGMGCNCGNWFDFSDFNEPVQLFIITEWLDTQHLHISTHKVGNIYLYTGSWEYAPTNWLNQFNTRTEAMKAAIESAVIAYNDKSQSET